MNNTVYKILKLPFTLLSSKACLLWLTGGWVLYYVTTAIWLDEAFAFFVYGVKNNTFIQIPFAAFLISGYLNLLRVFREKLSRSKLAFIAWLMISGGAMLYFTGFFLSINTRDYDNRIVGVGDFLDMPWSKERYYISAIKPGLRDSFRMTDTGGILQYEPKITIKDSSSRSYEVGAYPPLKINGTYIHILNYGLAPGVRFYRGGVLSAEGYMPLRILPPGRSDFFEIRPYPFRFLVFLASEHMDYSEHYPEPVYNLKDPLYNTRVFSGEKMVAEGDSREGLSFNDYKLSYFKPSYWIQIESARDPGIPFMRFGIFLLVFGIPVYILRSVLYIIRRRA
jgi:hypothetical protein